MAMTELEKRASNMKWDPPAPGTEERNKMPKSAFLSPSTRTFPYKILIDGQWIVSEKGLRSAISVANFRGNSTISAKASKMLEELIADEDNMQHKEIDDFLKHHGILGMKWGVRRQRGADGLVKGGTGKPTEEYLRAREFRQTPLKSLTNAQLRTLNERMQLERTYKDLTAKDKSSGSKIAGRILNKIGDRIIDRSINAGLDVIAGQIKRRI